MRTPTLGTGLLTLVLTAAVFAPGADADPTGSPDPDKPSAAAVRAAHDDATAARTKVDGLRARLDAAAAEADASSVRAAKAAEAWNGARWRAEEARTAKRAAVVTSRRADRTLRLQKVDYRNAVITAETMGLELSAVGALVSADGMESLLERSAATDHVQAMFDQQRDDFTEAADAAETAEAAATDAAATANQTLIDARVARDAAEAAEAEATATASRIGHRTKRLLRRLARLEGVSVAIAQRRQDAIAEERRAVRAAATPAVAHPKAVEPKPAPAGPEAGAADPKPADPPAPAGGAQAAIAYARAQIGEPYRWGASGPGSWDCSGLTAKAWEAGGTSLPHYSVAQYDASTPVTAGQLQPGDLVFWGEGGNPESIYHVALYVGSGRIIHAPRTGRPVTEESIGYWRTPDFYARP